MIRIPTISGVPRFSQRTILEGREYLFTFAWNDRAGAWILGIADASGASIVEGLRLQVGPLLCRLVRDPRCFPGDILVVDREGKGDPTLNDLGSRVFLAYVPAADL